MKIRSLLTAAVLAASLSVANAQEPVGIQGLMCDKPEQVVKTLKYAEASDTRSALERTNKEDGDSACVMSSVVAIRGGEVARTELKVGKVSIVEIIVVGVLTQGGAVPLQTPTKVYVPFLIEKYRGA
jgi:hypothetical protein